MPTRLQSAYAPTFEGIWQVCKEPVFIQSVRETHHLLMVKTFMCVGLQWTSLSETLHI